MLKNILHTLLIVLIAGLIAVGWYAFSLTPASQSLLPDRAETRPAATSVAQNTAQADVSSSATNPDETARPAAGYEGEGGLFSAQTGLGFLKHALMLAAITAAVLSVRKAITLIKNRQSGRTVKSAVPVTGLDQSGLERREFLRLSGLVLAGGALAMAYKHIDSSYAAAALGSGLNTPTTPTGVSNLPATSSQRCVACPKGRINDPYPGRCDLYIDNDGDGLCDYSVATACATLPAAATVAAGSNNAAAPASSTPTPQSQPQRCVACPKGRINDPYPGRCDLYIDNDGDGFCDYSVATATCNSNSADNYNSPGQFDFGGQGYKNGRQRHGNRRR